MGKVNNSYQNSPTGNFGDLLLETESSNLFSSPSTTKKQKQLVAPIENVTNQDAFVDSNNIAAGTYSHPEIGSTTLFASGAARRLPVALYQKIQAELDMKKQEAIDKINRPFIYDIPKVDTRYERDHQAYVSKNLEAFMERAKAFDKTKWKDILENPEHPLGKEFKNFQTENNLRANEINGLVALASDMLKESSKPGNTMSAEGNKIVNDVITGIFDFNQANYSSTRLADAAKKMMVHKTMTSVVDKVKDKIETDIKSTIANRVNQHNVNNPNNIIVYESPGYFKIAADVQREFVEQGRIDAVAKSLAVDQPSLFYDNEKDKDNTAGAHYSTSQAREYLNSLFGVKETSNFKIGTDQLPRNTNVSINNAKDTGSNVASVINELGAIQKTGGIKKMENASVGIGANGAVFVDKDGQATFVSKKNPKLFMQSFSSSTGKAEAGDITVNAISDEKQMNSLKSNLELNKRDPALLLPLSFSARQQPANLINWVANNYKAFPLGKTLIKAVKTKKIGDKDVFWFEGMENGQAFSGTVLPKELEIKGQTVNPSLLVRNGVFANFTGSDKVVSHGTYFTMSADGKDVVQVDKTGKEIAYGTNDIKSIKIDKENFMNDLNAVYERAVAAESTTDLDFGDNNEVVPNTSKIGSKTTKQEVVNVPKSIQFDANRIADLKAKGYTEGPGLRASINAYIMLNPSNGKFVTITPTK